MAAEGMVGILAVLAAAAAVAENKDSNPEAWVCTLDSSGTHTLEELASLLD